MKRLLTAALCAASMALASCATMPTVSSEQVAQIGTAIDRAQAAYDRISASAEPRAAVPVAFSIVRGTASTALGSVVGSATAGDNLSRPRPVYLCSARFQPRRPAWSLSWALTRSRLRRSS